MFIAKVTDIKIESAKKLLARCVPPKDVARNLGVFHSLTVPLRASLSAHIRNIPL